MTLTGRDHSSKPVSFQREAWVQGEAEPCPRQTYRQLVLHLGGPHLLVPDNAGDGFRLALQVLQSLENRTEMWMGTSCLSLFHVPHTLGTPPLPVTFCSASRSGLP